MDSEYLPEDWYNPAHLSQDHHLILPENQKNQFEGDILKLTIQPNGTFVYKQIGPCERARLKGVLVHDEESGNFQVLADGKKYKVILASVTYFKGEEGDEAAILVPQDKNSTWAAVENIIKKPRDIYKSESDDVKSVDVKTDIPKTEEDDLGL